MHLSGSSYIVLISPIILASALGQSYLPHVCLTDKCESTCSSQGPCVPLLYFRVQILTVLVQMDVSGIGIGEALSRGELA